jgi:hypothetical protein
MGCLSAQVDEAWRVKVCDFGLARKMPPAHEAKHLSVVGTDEWFGLQH